MKSNSAIVASGAAAAATAAGLVYLANRRYRSATNNESLLVRQRTKQQLMKLRPTSAKVGTVSHVRVKVADLTSALRFYHDLGLVDASEPNDTHALLKSPSPHEQPLLLLEVDPTREVRTAHAAAVGYARMCFLVKDVANEVERMKALGYLPIGPVVTDRPGSPDEKTGKNTNTPCTIVAYSDTDGNMVELVSIPGVVLGIFHKLGMLDFPSWVHVNINTASYERSYESFQKLGFRTETDFGRVVNNLYKALNIPDPGIAKQVSLIKLPDTHFSIDLIEWENATGGVGKTGSSLGMALTVNDVSQTIDELVNDNKGGWSVKFPPKCIDLPSPLGRAVQASVVDSDGNDLSLISYPGLLLDDTTLSDASVVPSSDKVVFVTGCDSGFGRSVACQLAGLGFRVVAACYTEAGAKFLSHIAETVVADLTTTDGVDRAVKTVCSACEDVADLWGVINNAGMCHPGNVEWTDPEAYKRVMALNFHAPVRIIHELLPLLKKSRGRVINVTSVCGILSSPSNSTYCTSKFALEALSDSLRVEMKPFGVDVVVLEPTTMKTPLGMGWTDMWKKNYDEADAKLKTNHSEEWANSYHEQMTTTLKAAGEDPMITVKIMMNSLVKARPAPRVLCGDGAKAYRIISLLPISMKDAVMKDPVGGLGDNST